MHVPEMRLTTGIPGLDLCDFPFGIDDDAAARPLGFPFREGPPGTHFLCPARVIILPDAAIRGNVVRVNAAGGSEFSKGSAVDSGVFRHAVPWNQTPEFVDRHRNRTGSPLEIDDTGRRSLRGGARGNLSGAAGGVQHPGASGPGVARRQLFDERGDSLHVVIVHAMTGEASDRILANSAFFIRLSHRPGRQVGCPRCDQPCQHGHWHDTADTLRRYLAGAALELDGNPALRLTSSGLSEAPLRVNRELSGRLRIDSDQ